MSTVVNKTTFLVLARANTPDYPTVDWLINPPGLQTLVGGGVPARYWKVTVDGLDLEEMTAPEKAAVDTNSGNLAAAKAAARNRLREDAESFLEGRYDSIKRDILIGMHSFSIVSRQRARRDYIASFMLWMESLYTYVDGIVDSINAASNIPAVLAVTYDFSPFDASDPQVDVMEASRRSAVAF